MRFPSGSAILLSSKWCAVMRADCVPSGVVIYVLIVETYLMSVGGGWGGRVSKWCTRDL